MARIFNTSSNRRNIKMSTDDVIAVISQYQRITKGLRDFTQIRNVLNKNNFYLPEDL